jgi:hypothetical protein
LGADSHTHELQDELDHAEQALAKFEARFGMSLAELEKKGLPTNASFETHDAPISNGRVGKSACFRSWVWRLMRSNGWQFYETWRATLLPRSNCSLHPIQI